MLVGDRIIKKHIFKKTTINLAINRPSRREKNSGAQRFPGLGYSNCRKIGCEPTSLYFFGPIKYLGSPKNGLFSEKSEP